MYPSGPIMPDQTAAKDVATLAAPSALPETKERSKQEEEEEEEEEEENVAPLHLHAIRTPSPRLHGTASAVSPPSSPLPSSAAVVGRFRSHSRSSSRSSMRSRSRSRSASPAPPTTTSATTNAVAGEVGNGPPPPPPYFDGGSSISSLEDVDPDILLDKMGFEELEPPPPHSITLAQLQHLSLPPVTERMSEETLDDCHAFSDFVPGVSGSSKSGGAAGGAGAGGAGAGGGAGDGSGARGQPHSRGGSITGSMVCEGSLLETLDEEEEGTDNDDDDDNDNNDEGDDKDGAVLVKSRNEVNDEMNRDVLLELLRTVSVTKKEREDLNKLKETRKS